MTLPDSERRALAEAAAAVLAIIDSAPVVTFTGDAVYHDEVVALREALLADLDNREARVAEVERLHSNLTEWAALNIDHEHGCMFWSSTSPMGGPCDCKLPDVDARTASFLHPTQPETAEETP